MVMTLPHDESDRLFAAAALVRGFIRDPSLEEFLTGADRSGSSLADRLVAAGAVSSAERDSFGRRLDDQWRECAGDPTRFGDFAARLIEQALERAESPVVRSFLAGGEVVDPASIQSALSRYRLLRVCGEGGLGQVWHARDVDLEREVAVKRMRADLDLPKEIRERFVREARLTGRLQHPNIIAIFQFGRDDQGREFYVMPLVHGETLDRVIETLHEKTRPNRPDPVELNRLLNRFLDVCHAVEFAHSKGILHRDLKPENIMIGRFGEVYVLDWGLARAVADPSDEDGWATLRGKASLRSNASLDSTRAGSIMGSPLYMAPEQAAGKTDEVGPAADLFALGGILFKILTGDDPRAPSEGETPDRFIRRIATESGPRPRSRARWVPRSLDATCARAGALEPEDRYPSVEAFAGDLRRWLAGEPISVYRERWPNRLAHWLQLHRIVAFALAILLFGALFISTLAIGFAVSSRRTVTRRQIHSFGDQMVDLTIELRAKTRLLADEMRLLGASRELRSQWRSARNGAANGADPSSRRLYELLSALPSLASNRPVDLAILIPSEDWAAYEVAVDDDARQAKIVRRENEDSARQAIGRQALTLKLGEVTADDARPVLDNSLITKSAPGIVRLATPILLDADQSPDAVLVAQTAFGIGFSALIGQPRPERSHTVLLANADGGIWAYYPHGHTDLQFRPNGPDLQKPRAVHVHVPEPPAFDHAMLGEAAGLSRILPGAAPVIDSETIHRETEAIYLGNPLVYAKRVTLDGWTPHRDAIVVLAIPHGFLVGSTVWPMFVWVLGSLLVLVVAIPFCLLAAWLYQRVTARPLQIG